MLVGAAAGFGVCASTGNPWLGLAAGALAGTTLSALHALLCLRFRANPFASGLCVWMIGFGLSATWGAALVGQSIQGFAPFPPALRALPVVGEVTPTVLLALAATPVVAAFLAWTRAGLAIRAVGESPEAARIAGIAVARVRA